MSLLREKDAVGQEYRHSLKLVTPLSTVALGR